LIKNEKFEKFYQKWLAPELAQFLASTQKSKKIYQNNKNYQKNQNRNLASFLPIRFNLIYSSLEKGHKTLFLIIYNRSYSFFKNKDRVLT